MRALFLLVWATGCFSPNYTSGSLRCDDGKCPSGFHCAANDTCWKNGSDPELDMSMVVDEDGGADLAVSGSDLAALPDLEPPADLTPPPKHQGEACGAGDTCDTGHCIDGYCCNSDCNNTCQACNIPGLLGICSNVAIGGAPVGSRSCNAQAASTCGRDGKCDGDGNCRNWPSGTVCEAGTCDVGTGNFVDPKTCNGSGTCVTNGSGNCAPYKCQNATECWSSCSTGDNSHCSGANTCMNNSCGLLPDGRACGTNSAQCQNGNCVDGFCCNSSCTNACQACDVPGSLGTCSTVAQGSPHGTRTCTNLGMTPCGGKCNGSLATCFYADNTVSCGSTCSSSTQVQKSACDSGGHCTAAAPATCTNNFKCVGSDCITSCNQNSDCQPTSHGCRLTDHVCKNFCVFDTDTFDNGCIYAP